MQLGLVHFVIILFANYYQSYSNCLKLAKVMSNFEQLRLI
jgi:hypothetical protein